MTSASGDGVRAGGLGSTYRLQLNGFGLRRAVAVVPYLRSLGIETLYVSPVTRAASGSTHGYDVVDPTTLDPALGADEDLEDLLRTVDANGMRLLVDIVPNHMANSGENRWWRDVLRHGRGSRYAKYFDIDWPAGGGRVLVPVLGRPFGECLEGGELTVERDSDGTELVIRYADLTFPVLTESSADTSAGPEEIRRKLNGRVGDPRSFDVLEALLDAQHYRLAYWKVSNHEVNYRRFFDIDGLVGIRVEDPDVYAETHRFVLGLARDPRVAGVRIDHVDGLADPGGYLARLRVDLRTSDGPDPVILVEKILARDEEVPDAWHVDGTTGYEFADIALDVLTDGRGARRIAAHAAGGSNDFDGLAHEARTEVLDGSFAGQLGRLAKSFAGAASTDRHGRDIPAAVMRSALRAVTSRMSVYRTYGTDAGLSSADVDRVDRACFLAASDTTDSETACAVEIVRRMLAGSPLGPERVEDARVAPAPWRQPRTRWQQLASAVAAKGVEDTALYRFAGLLSQADVGSEPVTTREDVGVSGFHERMTSRLARAPEALNATSTHDSKRSEDVRARLAVLSEIPERWTGLVDHWSEIHSDRAAAIFSSGVPRDVALTLYQTVFALWPARRHLGVEPDDALTDRIAQCALKSAREAKVHTSWTSADSEFEDSLAGFVEMILDPGDEEFHRDLDALVSDVGPCTAVNTLALTLLKVTAPGVPDVYQGTESLRPLVVDPDNRRPVDFSALGQQLLDLPRESDPGTARELRERWYDGSLKMLVTRNALHARRADRELFAVGDYVPLGVRGPGRDHLIAFCRLHHARSAVVVAPRLTYSLGGRSRMAVGDAWADTVVEVPVSGSAWRDVFTGREIEKRTSGGAPAGTIAVDEVLADLPVALLVQ